MCGFFQFIRRKFQKIITAVNKFQMKKNIGLHESKLIKS